MWNMNDKTHIFCNLFSFLHSLCFFICDIKDVKMLKKTISTSKQCWKHPFFVKIHNTLSLKQHFPFYSEDGFYSAAFRAPASGGQWNVEAISVSPLHGLRVSKTRSVRRTRPLDIIVTGVPLSVKRNETIRDVTVAVRNNMPVPMQVSHIVINKLQGSGFSSLL